MVATKKELVEIYTKDPDAIKTYSFVWGAADWAISTAYAVLDYVYNTLDGKIYQCRLAHTSSTGALEDDLEKWNPIEDGLWLPRGYTIQADVDSTWTVDAGDVTVDLPDRQPYSTTIRVSNGTLAVAPATTPIQKVRNRIVAKHSTLPDLTDDRTFGIRLKHQ